MRPFTIEALFEAFTTLDVTTTVCIVDLDDCTLYSGNFTEVPLDLYDLEVIQFHHLGTRPNDRIEITAE